MNTQQFGIQEKIAWLRLIRTENVGPVTFHRLIQRFGTAQAALDALPTLSKRGGRSKPLKACSLSRAEDEIAELDKMGATLVARPEADYPDTLRAVEDAPPLLTVLGHAHLLNKPALGVVGARNASLNGRKLAAELSRRTGEAGYVIASGLARGIDAAAHDAALQTGTVAVVAGGVDVIYPKENTELYHHIREQGAIVAENTPGTQPQARHFPRRNRIISGLSLGVLVVEAAARSGSLITARLAGEQGREVFAVPGSPLDPRSSGANNLLRDGAHLVTSADDIVPVLNSLRIRPLGEPPGSDYMQPPLPFDASPEADAALAGLRDTVLELLGPAPVHVDEVIRASGAPVADVLTVLLELEIAGRIERQPGNRVNLI